MQIHIYICVKNEHLNFCVLVYAGSHFVENEKLR